MKGDILFDKDEIRERWREYIGELYNDKDISNYKHFLEDEKKVCPLITRAQFLQRL